MLRRLISSVILAAFIVNTVLPPQIARAQTIGGIFLPNPGTIMAPSPAFVPVLIKGIKLHPENPLQFDFIIDNGHTKFNETEVKDESERLIKYFFAALTVPANDFWVNLSPHESERIIPTELSKTELGRDLLAQDYILKQLTASFLSPESEVGKKFWDKIYQQAQEKFGTRDLPIKTFNKVWITPESATIYENGQTAYIVKSHLKVMLDGDYKAVSSQPSAVSPLKAESRELKADINDMSAHIMREIVVPAIEQEVNEGKHFAPLRQIYNSLLLAKWYKQMIKDTAFSKAYVDQNKVSGIDMDDKTVTNQIYNLYVDAYKKGAYTFIKEDYDALSEESIPRKYFTGGIRDNAMLAMTSAKELNEADLLTGRAFEISVESNVNGRMINRAMLSPLPPQTSAPPGDRAMMYQWSASWAGYSIEMQQEISPGILKVRFSYPEGVNIFTTDGTIESDTFYYWLRKLDRDAKSFPADFIEDFHTLRANVISVRRVTSGAQSYGLIDWRVPAFELDGYRVEFPDESLEGQIKVKTIYKDKNGAPVVTEGVVNTQDFYRTISLLNLLAHKANVHPSEDYRKEKIAEFVRNFRNFQEGLTALNSVEIDGSSYSGMQALMAVRDIQANLKVTRKGRLGMSDSVVVLHEKKFGEPVPEVMRRIVMRFAGELRLGVKEVSYKPGFFLPVDIADAGGERRFIGVKYLGWRTPLNTQKNLNTLKAAIDRWLDQYAGELKKPVETAPDRAMTASGFGIFVYEAPDLASISMETAIVVAVPVLGLSLWGVHELYTRGTVGGNIRRIEDHFRDNRQREEAAVFLGKRRRGFDPLLILIREEYDPEVLKAMEAGLRNLGATDQQIKQALLANLSMPSHHGSPTIVQRLKELGTTDQELAEAYYILLGTVHWRLSARDLGRLGDKRAVEPLIKILEDVGESVPSSFENFGIEIIEILGRLGDASAVQPLKDLRQRTSDEDLKAAIDRALWQLAESGSGRVMTTGSALAKFRLQAKDFLDKNVGREISVNPAAITAVRAALGELNQYGLYVQKRGDTEIGEDVLRGRIVFSYQPSGHPDMKQAFVIKQDKFMKFIEDLYWRSAQTAQAFLAEILPTDRAMLAVEAIKEFVSQEIVSSEGRPDLQSYTEILTIIQRDVMAGLESYGPNMSVREMWKLYLSLVDILEGPRYSFDEDFVKSVTAVDGGTMAAVLRRQFEELRRELEQKLMSDKGVNIDTVQLGMLIADLNKLVEQARNLPADDSILDYKKSYLEEFRKGGFSFLAKIKEWVADIERAIQNERIAMKDLTEGLRTLNSMFVVRGAFGLPYDERIAQEVDEILGGNYAAMILARLKELENLLLDAQAPDPAMMTGKVLVVNDTVDTLELISLFLSIEGLTVIEAEDGDQVEALLLQHPDVLLIVSDIQMPRLEGRALARQLQQSHPAIPIIFATGFPDKGEYAAQALTGTSPNVKDVVRSGDLSSGLVDKIRSILSPDRAMTGDLKTIDVLRQWSQESGDSVDARALKLIIRTLQDPANKDDRLEDLVIKTAAVTGKTKVTFPADLLKEGKLKSPAQTGSDDYVQIRWVDLSDIVLLWSHQVHFGYLFTMESLVWQTISKIEKQGFITVEDLIAELEAMAFSDFEQNYQGQRRGADAPVTDFSDANRIANLTILGLEADATLADVKRARRKLVFRFHPDITGKSDYTEFNRIQSAYEALVTMYARRPAGSPDRAMTGEPSWSWMEEMTTSINRTVLQVAVASVTGKLSRIPVPSGKAALRQEFNAEKIILKRVLSDLRQKPALSILEIRDALEVLEGSRQRLSGTEGPSHNALGALIIETKTALNQLSIAAQPAQIQPISEFIPSLEGIRVPEGTDAAIVKEIAGFKDGIKGVLQRISDSSEELKVFHIMEALKDLEDVRGKLKTDRTSYERSLEALIIEINGALTALPVFDLSRQGGDRAMMDTFNRYKRIFLIAGVKAMVDRFGVVDPEYVPKLLALLDKYSPASDKITHDEDVNEAERNSSIKHLIRRVILVLNKYVEQALLEDESAVKIRKRLARTHPMEALLAARNLFLAGNQVHPASSLVAGTSRLYDAGMRLSSYAGAKAWYEALIAEGKFVPDAEENIRRIEYNNRTAQSYSDGTSAGVRDNLTETLGVVLTGRGEDQVILRPLPLPSAGDTDVPTDLPHRGGDRAMTGAQEENPVGGIDMNEIDFEKTGSGVQIEFNEENLKAIMPNGIQTLTPVIINIIPVTNILPLLGLQEKPQSELEISSVN